MKSDKYVIEVLKDNCKPGVASDKDYNQIQMLGALLGIKNYIIDNDIPGVETILDIIDTTIKGLTPIYD